MDINLNNNMKKFLLIWLMMVLMVVAGCKDERVVQFAQSEVQIVTSDGTIISVYDSYGDFSNCICRADDGTVVGAFLNNENGRVDILGYSPGETNVRIIDETTGGTLSMCRVRVLGPDDVDFEISDEQLSFQNTSQSIFVLKAQSKYNLMATSTNYTPSSLFYLSVESDNDEVAQVKLIECFPPNPDGQTNWHTKHNEFTHKFEYSYCEIPIELVGAGEACITISFANGSNGLKKCHISVSEVSVTSVTLSNYYLYGMRPMNKYQLKATVHPENATNKNVIWYSSNPDVVTVDSDGWIEAVGVGDATIYAEAEDGGVKAWCAVRSTAFIF